MTQGPPCASCGSLLRWVADRQQWGCDRCRVMYPASVIVNAQAGAPVRARAPAAVAPRRRGRKRFVALAAFVVVAAAAAIVATLVIRRGKDDGPATPAPRDAGSAGFSGNGSAGFANAGSAGSAGSAAHPPVTPPPPPFDVDAPNLTLGTPVAAPIGDFWSWPRSDGAVLVTSPLIDAVFPAQPTFELKPGAATKDGTPTEVYTISVADKAHILELQLVALGRNARDDGAVATMQAAMQKLGPVTRTARVEGGQQVTRLVATEPATATTEDSRMVVDARIDLPRGLFVYATADTVPSHTALGDAFLAHVHVRAPADATVDPETLTGVRVRRSGAKLEVHDKADGFVVAVPWMATVTRTLDAPNGAVHVAIVAVHGRPGATPSQAIDVEVDEKSAWDALAVTPSALDRLTHADEQWASAQRPKRVAAHLVWNRFQHRLYRIRCTAAPCDGVVASLRFAPATPVR